MIYHILSEIIEALILLYLIEQIRQLRKEKKEKQLKKKPLEKSCNNCRYYNASGFIHECIKHKAELSEKLNASNCNDWKPKTKHSGWWEQFKADFREWMVG